MRKFIFPMFALIISASVLVALPKNAPIGTTAKEPPTYLQMNVAENTSTEIFSSLGEHFNIFDISTEYNREYIYEIFNAHGELVKREGALRRPPVIVYLDEFLLSIEFGVGTGTWMTQYYHITNDIFSETFESPIAIKYNKIAYVLVYENAYKLIVRDIFDKSIYYERFNLKLSPVANPMDALINIEHLYDNRLRVTYLSGEDYMEKSSIFQL